MLARCREVNHIIQKRDKSNRLGRGIKDLKNLPGGQHLTLLLK